VHAILTFKKKHNARIEKKPAELKVTEGSGRGAERYGVPHERDRVRRYTEMTQLAVWSGACGPDQEEQRTGIGGGLNWRLTGYQEPAKSKSKNSLCA